MQRIMFFGSGRFPLKMFQKLHQSTYELKLATIHKSDQGSKE